MLDALMALPYLQALNDVRLREPRGLEEKENGVTPVYALS